MFGFAEIKKDLIVVGIVVLCIFGLYKYHQGLVGTIAERDATIVKLNATIKDRDTTIKTLETANSTLFKDVEQEQEMCKVRVKEVADYYVKEAAHTAANSAKRGKNKTKIDVVNNDPNKTADQKLQETLEIEYDILTGN